VSGGLSDLGRVLLLLGGCLFLLVLVFTFAGKVPWLGRLPGDFVYRRGSFTLYVPLGTCLLLSLLLTLALRLIRR
jgi:hypothetical protein